MITENEKTVDELFLDGYSKFHQSKSSSLEIFLSLDFKLQKLDLFSSNESISDLNEKYLKFLLVPSFIGLALTDLYTGDRQRILSKAKNYLEEFLLMMENYEIMSRKDQQWLEQVKLKQSPKVELIRDIKIQQYKREKETLAKIKYLQDTKNESVEFYYSVFDLMIQQSITGLKEILQEEEMLEYKRLKESQESSRSDKQNTDDRVDSQPKITQYSGPMLSSSGKPLRPFVITSDHAKRESIRKGVFRPGHNLPTMTVEEYIDREMERGNFLSGGGKMPDKPEIDEDDDNYANQETYKAREWDEFKDFNPAGWGNRHNKG